MSKDIYIFDLDNTLCYTDELNNYSYNTALSFWGLSPIINQKRITREVLLKKYPQLEFNKYKNLINLKQIIFLLNLYQIRLNNRLVSILKNNNKKRNVLWTSANKNRALAILNFFNLNDNFEYFMFSKKQNVKKDIEYLSLLTNSQSGDFIFYEDNAFIISQLEKFNMNVHIA